MSPQGPRPHRSQLAPALFLLGLSFGLLSSLVMDRWIRTSFDGDLELLRAVRDLAVHEFVTEVEEEQLMDEALRGMLGSLDRHSRFYGPEEIRQLDRETSGEFRGVGVIFQSVDEGRILFPYPGSPAARAGLEVGDRILSVDGVALADMGEEGLRGALRTSAETLEIHAVSLGGEEKHVAVQPAPVIDPTVRHTRMLDEERGIGYLAILSFSHRTPGEFDEAVDFLVSQGMTSLVVDLRGNLGGIFDSAVRVANRFIARGTIVGTRTRRGIQVTEARPSEARWLDLPVAVLVDASSASASEILAGALQDHCAAVLVGTPTYGKGTVQTLRRFGEDRAIVKMTTATYYTPSWRRIERDQDDLEHSGIAPDLLVELESQERATIHRHLGTYSPPPALVPAIRSWEEHEEVALLSPSPPDRQLDAARSLLAGSPPELRVPSLRGDRDELR